MTTTATYPLKVNSDLSQNTRYPLGNKPVPEELFPPTAFAYTDITTTTMAMTWVNTLPGVGTEIQQWIVNVSVGWDTVATPGDGVTQWEDDGLPKGSHIGHRIATRGADGSLSDWGPEIWADTDSDSAPPPTGGEWAGLTPNVFASHDSTGGTGTSGDPWELGYAMTQIVAGDVLGVYKGVYVGTRQAAQDYEKRYTPAYYPRNNGTAGNPITIVAQWPAAYHSDPSSYSDIRSGATVDASDADGDPDATGGWPAFGTTVSSYTTWIGMYSSGVDYNNKWTYDAAPCSLWWGTDNTATQCKLIGSDNDWTNGKRNYCGITMRYNTNCTATDNVFKDFYGGTGRGNSAGIILYNAKNYLIQNNHVIRCTYGFQYKGGTEKNLQSLYGSTNYNLIENCHDAFHFHGPSFGPQGQRNPFKHNLALECNNFLHQTLTAGEDAFDGADFTNNTFRSSKTQENAGSVFWNAPGSSKSNTYKNNIHAAPSVFTGSYNGNANAVDNHMACSYNCTTDTGSYMTNPESHTMSSWRAQTGQEEGSFTDDPLFVGASDSRLQSGSPCRGSGSGGATMGCYITGDEEIGVRS